MHMELYERLGFDDNKPSSDEIKQRYRKLASMLHPDKNIGAPDKDEKEEQFRQVQEAYDILYDEKKRKAYDENGLINDRDEETQKQEAVFRCLRDLYLKVIEVVPEDDLDVIDLREVLFLNIDENRDRLNEEMEKRNRSIRKIETVIKRMCKKKENDTEDTLGSILKNRIGVVKAEIKSITNGLEVFAAMRKIVKTYKYNFDEQTIANSFKARQTNVSNATFKFHVTKGS